MLRLQCGTNIYILFVGGSWLDKFLRKFVGGYSRHDHKQVCIAVNKVLTYIM
mgnify:CR=1 FL=1